MMFSKVVENPFKCETDFVNDISVLFLSIFSNMMLFLQLILKFYSENAVLIICIIPNYLSLKFSFC